MVKIGIYNPQVVIWQSKKKTNDFHGYASEFIARYADYIYTKNLFWMIKYKIAFIKLKIKPKAKFIYSMNKMNNKCDILVCFQILGDEFEMAKFDGTKYIHTTDYYINSLSNKELFDKIKPDYLLAHAQLDIRSSFFKKYYCNYIGKTISIPFGYSRRFSNNIEYSKRIKKAVVLGSIHSLKNTLKNNVGIKEWYLFNINNSEYEHPLRHYLLKNVELYSSIIDSYLTDEKQVCDYSYDANEVLNSYMMFINDEGLSNFPPARTFEGIACGSVMVASDSEIYKDIGFIPDINYISFRKNDYVDMLKKIEYYLTNIEKLQSIQKESLQLSKNFSHTKIADMLYKNICDSK